MIRHLLLSLIACVAFSAYGADADDAKPGATKRLTAAEWCFEDDLPKSACVNCDKKVALALKKDGDFCKEHNCAESLCVKCDPKAQAKIDAQRPDAKEWPANWKPKATAK
jgi:hypothetical protein